MKATRRRLTLKLVALLVAPTGLGVSVLAFGNVYYRRAELLTEADRELEDHLSLLQSTLVGFSAGLPASNWSMLSAQASLPQRVHGVALYDSACRSLGRSGALDGSREAVDRIACSVLRSRRPFHGEITIGRTEALVRAEPLDRASAVGVILVSHDLSHVEHIIRRGRQSLLVFAGGLLTAMALVGLWLARTFGRSFVDLSDASELIASGNLSARISERGPFELGRVGRSFNAMAAELGLARERLERYQLETRELERRLAHAQSLQLIGQVAASLAHDIASPLSTIVGWARLSSDDPSLPTEARRQFEIIAVQCDRIQRLVRRLLDVARPAGEASRDIDVREVVRDAAAFFEPEARSRRIGIRTELPDTAVSVSANRDQLLQALVNLGVNALHAQPDGGAVVFAIRCGGPVTSAAAPNGERARTNPADDEIDAGDPTASPLAGSCALEVRDAGPGVPAEMRGQVFEPFYSTKRPAGGTGLGLSIVRHAVEQLGGTIAIDDAPEGGACFRIVLPISDPAA